MLQALVEVSRVMIRTCTRLTARTHRTEERIKPDGDKI
jgi:hypothetical protein